MNEHQLPKIDLPESLPITACSEAIIAALQRHQVLIIAGETGSGKSTQLPKLCLLAGLKRKGYIGHTQPRRLAARSIAARLSEELQSPLGEVVGYKVRFKDQVAKQSLIKVMTDGILLAEIQKDRLLKKYDVIIIDEAHERSLNIDFLLGFLKQLLPKRPELKVIITSATIDQESFQSFFPRSELISVSGRSYPVDIHYHNNPADDNEMEGSLYDSLLLSSLEECIKNGPGDVLVFLSGERDIRSTLKLYQKHYQDELELLPLYAKLSTQEQNKIFSPKKNGKRRVILATNLAETSLTVPGICYVIDTGLARVSRYNMRHKIQSLPIEKISQSSANQRAGRCGRVQAGVCQRLYSEEDLLARAQYSTPEILRTNLAQTILQMKAWNLGDIEAFPFINKPEAKHIRSGLRCLVEIGALDDKHNIIKFGRRINHFPVDPRLGSILLHGAELNCLQECLVIVSFLSVQDPRVRPLEKQQHADEMHRAFADKKSDFIFILNLWQAINEAKENNCNRDYRTFLKKHYLSIQKVQEWRDIYYQLREQATTQRLHFNKEMPTYELLHQALLFGFVTHIAKLSPKNDYVTAADQRCSIFPGSYIKSKPKWLLSSHYLSTTRLYSHINAEVQPEWIERAAQHLIRKSYSNPHWQMSSGYVTATEKVDLFNLTITNTRRVSYGAINPVEAQEIFIREALVTSELRLDAEFYQHNCELWGKLNELEEKVRRRDFLVDSEAIVEFYKSRLPAFVNNTAALKKYNMTMSDEQKKSLFLTEDDCTTKQVNQYNKEDFPNHLLADGLKLALNYHFDPASTSDGITTEIAISDLPQVQPEAFEWLIPGILEAKICALLKALPKSLRKHFVPIPETAAACMPYLVKASRDKSLLKTLSELLLRLKGFSVPVDSWQHDKLPEFCRTNFQVVDAQGEVIAEGRDLGLLKKQCKQESCSVITDSKLSLELCGLTEWTVDDLVEIIQVETNGNKITAYPALVDEQESVSLKCFPYEYQAVARHGDGVRRLIYLTLRKETKYCLKNMPHKKELGLFYLPIDALDNLQVEIILAAIQAILEGELADTRSRSTFDALLQQASGSLTRETNEIAGLTYQTLKFYHQLDKSSLPQDVTQQIKHLLCPGFLLNTPKRWLKRLPIYTKGILVRQEKPVTPQHADLIKQVKAAWSRYEKLSQTKLEEHGVLSDELIDIRFAIEELRLSFFAQALKTSMPISSKRLGKMFEKLGS